MDWLDYREKLNIGFSDKEKFEYFKQKIFNVLEIIDVNCTSNEYFAFCDKTGSAIDKSQSYSYYSEDTASQNIISIIQSHSDNINELFSYIMAFINTRENPGYRDWGKADLINMLRINLEESHIPYEIIEDEDGYFIFPKGAKELDDALVSEPLAWLSSYPKTRKTFTIALKQYSDGIYIRDVADNFRKALEEFFQEFLGNSKNLAKNKIEIFNYLKEHNAESEVSSMFQSLINSYDKLNNKVAKHNDKVDAKYLEFLMYQTGLFIRMLIIVKETEQKVAIES